VVNQNQGLAVSRNPPKLHCTQIISSPNTAENVVLNGEKSLLLQRLDFAYTGLFQKTPIAEKNEKYITVSLMQ
jgi:hypothetical protein